MPTLRDIIGSDILAGGNSRVFAGGPGSGCHGENCGRHGGGKGTDKTHVPKSATVSGDKAALKSVLSQLKGIAKDDLTHAERAIMGQLNSRKDALSARKAISKVLSGISYQDMTIAERNIRNIVGNY